jgi:hypothetical protein
MKKLIFKIIFALGFLSISCNFIIKWLIISKDETKSIDQVNKEYLSIFPKKLQDVVLITFIELTLLIISALLFYSISIQQSNNKLKKIFRTMAIISILISTWLLFTLM